jgi:hypothetical protein
MNVHFLRASFVVLYGCVLTGCVRANVKMSVELLRVVSICVNVCGPLIVSHSILLACVCWMVAVVKSTAMSQNPRCVRSCTQLVHSLM